jgi:hypothetical protein
MSDKLISLDAALNAVYALHAGGKDAVMNPKPYTYAEDLHDVVEALSELPAAEPPMSAVEYVDALERMFVEDHQVYDEWYDVMLADDGDVRENRHKAVALVEAWAKEHPERSEE